MTVLNGGLNRTEQNFFQLDLPKKTLFLLKKNGLTSS
jgi:hypothetical protein